MPGSAQPVCVEWASAQLGFWLKDDPWVNRGERFVSYASDESLCDSFRPVTADSPPARTKPAPVPKPGRRAAHPRAR